MLNLTIIEILSNLLIDNILHATLAWGQICKKKTTAMAFIWGDRGYPAIRFEYKTASEWYLVDDI